MESAAEPDDLEFGDTAHCRLALRRPVVSLAKEAAENTVEASQITEAAKVAETQGAAQVAKEAFENTVEASQITEAALFP